jgi:hypothetical protein
MACGQQGNWTIRFPQTTGPNGPMELLPESLTLRQKTDDLDYCRASFSPNVGEELKPHTRRRGDGQLRYQQEAHVLYNGTLISRLRFTPDNVSYDDSFTKIELDDLQKSMDTETIDTQYPKARLRDIYTDIYERVKAFNNFFEGMKFTIPDDMVTEVWGELGLGEDWDRRTGLFETGIHVKEVKGIASEIAKIGSPMAMQKLRSDEHKELLDSNYAFDFRDDSPFKAIQKLNDKFGAETWTGRDGYLWVGERATHGNMFYAARDDHRALTLQNATIRHPRDPILGVIVEGKWIDPKGFETGLDMWADWFNPMQDGEGGDVRAQGVCVRDDISTGEVVKFQDTEASRTALEPLAREKFMSLMKQQHSGQVNINPKDSGFDFGHPALLKPGDFIHVVPEEKHFQSPNENSGRIGTQPDYVSDCEDYVNNEIYHVTGVTHTIEGESWNISLDVAMYPDEPIRSGLRYFDPDAEEFVETEVFADGLIDN